MEDKWGRWVALTAIAPMAWGSTYFVTGHLLPPDAALWGGVIRCLPAGLLLLALVRRLPTGSWWWRSFVLGLLSVGGLNVLVYVVAQRLPSSLAATLMSTSAASMLLLSWLILHQRPKLAAVLGAFIGIAGVVVMMGFGAGPIDPWGVVASIVAMLSSTLGFVLTAKWGTAVPPTVMASWQLVAGSLVVLPAAIIVEGPPPPLDAPAIAGFAYLIVVATAIAYAAWFTGLRRLSGSAVGIIGLLNPVTGVLLGVLLGGEVFGIAQAVGLALVIGGVLLGVRAGRSPDKAATSLEPTVDYDSSPMRSTAEPATLPSARSVMASTTESSG